MNYYPIYQQNQIAPYHAREAMPLIEIARWIKDALPGQSFVVKGGPVSGLPPTLRDYLTSWEDGGIITYKAIKASPASLSSDKNDWRVHVTRTEKGL